MARVFRTQSNSEPNARFFTRIHSGYVWKREKILPNIAVVIRSTTILDLTMKLQSDHATVDFGQIHPKAVLISYNVIY